MSCALAPSIPVLVAAHAAQGVGAAVMTRSSLALIRQTFADHAQQAEAIALWTLTGSVAAALGPLVGGALNLLSGRLIFFVNLPVGLLALVLLARAPRSARRPVPFDAAGQVSAVVAMTALVLGVVEAGAHGIGAGWAWVPLLVAVVAAAAFVLVQHRVEHPMVPLALLGSRVVLVSSWTGFAFIGCWFGTVFLLSLTLQTQRGLSPFAAGLVFVPAAALSGAASVLTARMVVRRGPRRPVPLGTAAMATALLGLALAPVDVPLWVVVALLVPVSACGPLAMQPTTGVLLAGVPADRAGVASAVFNTCRQLGGALSVAVLAGLVGASTTAQAAQGRQAGLLLLAVLAATAVVANLRTPATVSADP